MTARRSLSLLTHTASVVFLVATISFLLLQVVPGDPALVIAGVDADQDTVRSIRQSLGLDAPLHARYLSWITGALTGDLGTSYTQGQPVSRLIAERLPLTAALAGLSLIISSVLGLGLAVVARVHRWIESAVRVIEYAAFAFPQFWIGLLLVFIFGFRLGWFPVLGGTGARALVLPACALSLGNAAVLSRTLRASLAEQMQSGYVVAARALGIRERRIRIVHVLPLAIIPVVAILAIQAGYLLAGTIVIEQVFGLAGLGQLAVTAVAQRDVPLVQGTVVVFAIAFPVLSMIGEIVISGLWPRMGKRR